MGAIELSAVENCVDRHVFKMFNCALLQTLFMGGFRHFDIELPKLRDETVDDFLFAQQHNLKFSLAECAGSPSQFLMKSVKLVLGRQRPHFAR